MNGEMGKRTMGCSDFYHCEKMDAVLQQTHLTLTGVVTYLSSRASKSKFSMKQFLKSVAYENVLRGGVLHLQLRK